MASLFVESQSLCQTSKDLVLSEGLPQSSNKVNKNKSMECHLFQCSDVDEEQATIKKEMGESTIPSSAVNSCHIQWS